MPCPGCRGAHVDPPCDWDSGLMILHTDHRTVTARQQMCNERYMRDRTMGGGSTARRLDPAYPDAPRIHGHRGVVA